MTELGFPSLRSASFQRSSDDDFIICITGGSLAKWFALDGAVDLVSELQSHSAFTSRNIVVCGLSNGGYKQPQQMMAVNYILSLGAEFDVLVNIDGFNEVALHESENLPRGVHPAFPRQWHLRVGSLPTPELLRLAGRADLAQQQRIDLATHYSHGLKQYSMLCNLWWTFRDRSLTKQYQELLHEFRRFRSEDHEYAQTGPPWYANDGQDVYRCLAGIWTRSSRQLHDLCRGRSVPYIHLLQPDQYVADSKPLTDWERKHAIRQNHPYALGFNKGYPLLREAGRRLRIDGVNFTDLTEMFADTRETMYRDDCCHLNQDGNGILSRTVANLVVAACASEAVVGRNSDLPSVASEN